MSCFSLCPAGFLSLFPSGDFYPIMYTVATLVELRLKMLKSNKKKSLNDPSPPAPRFLLCLLFSPCSLSRQYFYLCVV